MGSYFLPFLFLWLGSPTITPEDLKRHIIGLRLWLELDNAAVSLSGMGAPCASGLSQHSTLRDQEGALEESPELDCSLLPSTFSLIPGGNSPPIPPLRPSVRYSLSLGHGSSGSGAVRMAEVPFPLSERQCGTVGESSGLGTQQA